jgi:lipopolysaccharide transport system permease protein
MEKRSGSAIPLLHENRPTTVRSWSSEDLPLTVIEPRPGWHSLDVKEIWRYRNLLYFLTLRDIQVRFKQTVLGLGWSVLKPFITVLVFSFFIGWKFKGQGEDFGSYGVTVFAGILPWFLFANSLASGASSVVAGADLVTRVNFPRLLLPLSCMLANLVDFVIGLVMLIAVAIIYRMNPGWGILLMPLVLLLLLAAVLGVSALLAALMVTYHDVSHLLQFLIMIWFFTTSTIFSKIDDAIPPWQRLVLSLNPPYGLIANFRTSVLGGTFDFQALLVSGAVSILLLFFGCHYFRRVERGFADIV